MTTIKVIDLPVDGDAFQAIYDQHGDGDIDPRYDYSECTEERFPDHKVIRGLRADGSVTGTGFLHIPLEPDENPRPAGVIAGVNQIDRGAPKDNP